VFVEDLILTKEGTSDKRQTGSFLYQHVANHEIQLCECVPTFLVYANSNESRMVFCYDAAKIGEIISDVLQGIGGDYGWNARVHFMDNGFVSVVFAPEGETSFPSILDTPIQGSA
jgi:hypothetical protein